MFSDPDEFKIDRSPNPHLALGFGIHFCLGAHLARLEGRIVAESMAHRYSAITLADPTTASVGDLGGPKVLQVIFA
jgi:cytochrome P450